MKKNCNICNNSYSSYQSLCNHKKKFHNIVENKIKDDKKYNCLICDKIFNDRSNKSKHEKTCNKLIIEEKKKEIEILKLKIQLESTPDLNPDLNLINKENNNQFINVILNKDKKIEELKKENNKNSNNKNENTNEFKECFKMFMNEYTNFIDDRLEQIIKNTYLQTEEPTELIINNCLIKIRFVDNYIDAIELCNAGNKKFNDWYSLKTSKSLINKLEKIIKPEKETLLVEINEEEIWIHPQLAINISQWISLEFSLEINNWIFKTLEKNKSKINLNLLGKEHELQLKDKKIKLLENLILKRQKRQEYPEKNVIYIVTTENNKKDNIYIIGKAKNLKNRLSTYNKTNEHEVIFYGECKSEEDMNIIELSVLNKLKKYRELANRDRFILPEGKNISFFVNIIKDTIKFNQESIIV
jgi:hypothetical protein